MGGGERDLGMMIDDWLKTLMLCGSFEIATLLKMGCLKCRGVPAQEQGCGCLITTPGCLKGVRC